MPTQIPAFLQQPQLQGLIQSYPLDTNYIGGRWFPLTPVAADELLINIEVPEIPMAPFVTLDQESPRDQEELLTQIRASLAYIRFKKVFKESELRIFGLRDGAQDNPTLITQMQDEARAKILRHIARLRNAVDARLEWLAIQAMTGSIAYNDERIKFTVNFPGVYTGGGTAFTKWDQNNANPIKDINRWLEEMGLFTGEDPAVIVAGRKVYRTMAESTELKALFTNWANGGQTAEMGPALLSRMFNDWFNLERVTYDARITTRSYSASGAPQVTRQRMLSEKHILLLPASALGSMASSPNPIDFGGTGLYSWTKQDQDPWIVETGVGVNAFPQLIWPERCAYIQVLT